MTRHRSQEDLDDERRLVEAAQRDSAQFSVLYDRYVDQIFAYAYSLTRNTHHAEDVTATTFARALEELPRFEWRGVPYSAWLYRVAANQVARDRRRPGWIQLSPHLPDSGLDNDPEQIVALRDRDDHIRAAVAALPDDQRQAVQLRFGGDLRNRDIADIMGRSEGAVKLLTFRAMTTLRRRLGAPLPAEHDDHEKPHRRHA